MTDEASYLWEANPFLIRTVVYWRRKFAEVALMLLASVCSLHRASLSKAVEHSSVTKSKLRGKVSFCIMPAVIVCDFHLSVTLSVCPTGLLVWRNFLTYLWCFQNNLKLSVLARPLQDNWKNLSGHQCFKYRSKTCWRQCVTVIWIQC